MLSTLPCILGEKVDLDHMRAFGAEAYVLVQPQGSKLAPRSTRCYFLGSKNAVFDENSVLKHSWPIKNGNVAQPVEIKNRFAVLRQDDPEEEKNERMPELDDDSDSDDENDRMAELDDDSDSDDGDSDAELDMGPAQALDDPWLEEPATRRSGRLPKYNKFLMGGHVSYAAAEAFIATPEDSIPPPEEAARKIGGGQQMGAED
jgi:hypothetical protein